MSSQNFPQAEHRILRRAEVDAGGGAAEDGGDFLDIVGKSVGNGDAATDAGAALFFAIMQGRENGFAPGIRIGADRDESIDKFDDGRPVLCGVHRGDHPFG